MMVVARQQHAEMRALAQAVARRERLAVAQALNLVDNRRDAERQQSACLFEELKRFGLYERGHIVGLTGPPGAGKSTLAGALIEQWLLEGKSVGVLAVDPSSPVSGGALLGDRLRMQRSDHSDVFIRSLSARGEQGGLSPQTLPMSRVLLAGYDRVLLETVGIGQSETDITRHADTTILLMQPQSGDTVQFIKAGVTETPDLVVVGKADLGEAAARMERDLRQSLPAREDGTRAPVLSISAFKPEAVSALAAAIEAHRMKQVEERTLGPRRRQHEIDWALKRLKEEFGTHGLALVGGPDAIKRDWENSDATPFDLLDRQRIRLFERYADNSKP
jgi:LAO/AO transport system kinase